MEEALAEVGNFKIGGRIIKVRFAAKTQEKLQDVVKRQINTKEVLGHGNQN